MQDPPGTSQLDLDRAAIIRSPPSFHESGVLHAVEVPRHDARGEITHDEYRERLGHLEP